MDSAMTAERAATMTWMCMACGQKWRDLSECKGVLRAGCPNCGSKEICDCNASPAAPHPCDDCTRVGVINCVACITAMTYTPLTAAAQEVAHG